MTLFADAMLTFPDGSCLYLIRADGRGKAQRTPKRRTMAPTDYLVKPTLPELSPYDDGEYLSTIVDTRRRAA